MIVPFLRPDAYSASTGAKAKNIAGVWKVSNMIWRKKFEHKVYYLALYMLYGPFPHLCEQKHQLDASSDEIQSFGGNSPVHLSPSLGAGSAVREKGDKKNRRAKQTERESGERKGRRSFSLPSPPLDFPFFCCFTPFFARASTSFQWMCSLELNAGKVYSTFT